MQRPHAGFLDTCAVLAASEGRFAEVALDTAPSVQLTSIGSLSCQASPRPSG